MNNDENNLLYDSTENNSTSNFTNSKVDNIPILECNKLI